MINAFTHVAITVNIWNIVMKTFKIPVKILHETHHVVREKYMHTHELDKDIRSKG